MLTQASVIEELRQDGITRETVMQRFDLMSRDDQIETIWQCIQMIYGHTTFHDALEEFTEAVLSG